ncbi:hypothetical protein CAEBREN_11989 [Caenorhabditis brenneri]|uniref:Domain of unknown function WSN domain-containing protein n=1 Tax=Caenorhabditis brenneri TaxID=135651 RepID=G0P8W0_CAEBE|nr:hypothetical protein CAEBREN_11989 [Caenorhabditis brenneri]
MTGSEVLTNFIEIKHPQVLKELKEVETAEKSKKLDEISNILKTFGESSIQDPKLLRENFKVLPEFLENTELLEKASAVSLTDDFRTKLEAATSGHVSIEKTVFGELPLINIAESLEYTLNESLVQPTEHNDIFKLQSSILSFPNEYEHYKEYIGKLKDYETALKDLIAFGGLNLEEVLKPVMELKKLADKYESTKLGNTGMVEWMKSLRTEAEKVENSNLLASQATLDGLIKDLDELFPLVKDLSVVKLNSKQEDSILFKNEDFDDHMFMKKFAEGEKKYMEKLKKSLAFLETFSGKLEVVIKGFEEFTSSYSEFDVYALKRIVAKIQKVLEKMNVFSAASATIKTSLDNSIKCLEDNALTYPQKNVNLDLFETKYEFSWNLQKKINEMHETAKKILGITEIENYEILDKLKAAITAEVEKLGSRMTVDQAMATVNAMKGVDNVQDFFKKFQGAADLLLEIDNKDLKKMLAEQLDLSVITKTQEYLSDTNLIPALKCLKDANAPVVFNPQEHLQLMDLIDETRRVQEEDIQKAKEILTKMDSMKKGLDELETASKRSKRDASAESDEKKLLKLEKKTADELENGVKVLRRIRDVNDEKEEVVAATNYGKKVDDAIFSIKMPPMQTVWTPIIRQKIQKVFKEIEQLEKLAGDYKGKELPSVFGIMDNATVVNGFEIDTRIFQDSVLMTLEASPDPDVQKVAPAFKKLSTLDLSFASHHDVLRTAAKTFEPLRTFFDGFFGIDRTPKKMMQNGTDVGGDDGAEVGERTESQEGDSSLLLLLVAAILIAIICFIVIIFFCVKRRNRNKKLQDKETWRHLFLIKKGADLKAFDSNYETPLDRAKSNKNLLNMMKKYSDKTYKKTLPQVFPSEKYKIYIDEKVKGKKAFCDRFKSNIVNKIDKATHVIVKTGKEASFELDNDEASLSYLGIICSHKMLMSSDWMSASVEKVSNFANDFKFRVKKIKFNGKSFKKVDDIQLENSKMRIPYLTNTIIHFDQAALHTIDWTSLKKLAVDLGSQNVDEFPVMQGMMAGKCPYYRQDLGHILVVYSQNNADKLTAMYPILKTEKSYCFLEKNEFIELLLSQKTVHKKLKGGDGVGKSKETTGSGETTGTTGLTGISGISTISGSTEQVTPANNSTTPTPSQTPTPVGAQTGTPSATPSAEENNAPPTF